MPSIGSDERVREGIRFTTPLRSITAATTTTMLHQITAGRTAVIKKLHWIDRNAAGGQLQIGSTDSATGGITGTFTQRIPAISMLSGQDDRAWEDEIPQYEFRKYADGSTDIVMQATVGAASPNDVQVQAEIEEFEA